MKNKFRDDVRGCSFTGSIGLDERCERFGPANKQSERMLPNSGVAVENPGRNSINHFLRRQVISNDLVLGIISIDREQGKKRRQNDPSSFETHFSGDDASTAHPSVP